MHCCEGNLYVIFPIEVEKEDQIVEETGVRVTFHDFLNFQ